MILFIEPFSKNIGMYVPAYPLPIMEIASFVKIHRPEVKIKIASIPMDYGLPLNKNGKEGEYDILPYAFSRGCPYQCNFCMEEYLRAHRKTVPSEIVREDLTNLHHKSNIRTLLISDALFKSFDLFPFFRSLGIKVNFETRCDVLDPLIIPQIADVCGILALGFESASYNTLRRMNKVRDRSHYEKYISNTQVIFKQAVKNEIPYQCFRDNQREIFNIQDTGLSAFRRITPAVISKYKELMSGQRNTRILPL